MMKRIAIIVLACVNLVGFTSCTDFLDENPKSSLTGGAYYKTESQAWSNVNYLYRNGAPSNMMGAGSAYIGPFTSIEGMLTGYFSNSYEGQELTCKYARELTRQENTMTVSSTMDGVWDNSYQAINVANGAIKYIPNIKMAEGVAKQLVAEAKFFRAFNYFYLVKSFGAVPMPTEPYEKMENLYLKRSEVSTIYALIESDLNDAIAVLPAVKFSANGHRITKWVAAMMLTAVYMQENKYAEASETAKIVIKSDHKLTNNIDLDRNSAFNQIRSIDDLDESIYAYEYDNSISSGGWWPTYAFNSSAVAVFGTYSIFERVYGPINRFLNVYEKSDLRVQPNQFFHWEYTNPNNGKNWKSELAGCWFFYDEDALLNSGKSTKDRDFFRYAEALLYGAEAIAQSQGITSEAAGYLAQIKARANMEGKTVDEIATALQALSKEEFIKACWIERLREFPFEFKIWGDCLRTGMFPVISETTPGSVDFVKLIGAKNAAGATFKESDLLWPIPLSEIQRNPNNLTQNAGYAAK